MNALQLLDTLQERGATLETEGDALRVTPSRVLDDDLRAAIRCHKIELIALLELTECVRRAYDPAQAFAFANRLYRIGKITEPERDVLQTYALQSTDDNSCLNSMEAMKLCR